MRARQRLSPLALICVGALTVAAMCGRIDLVWIDIDDKNPMLLLKPYTLSLDRAELAIRIGASIGWRASKKAAIAIGRRNLKKA